MLCLESFELISRLSTFLGLGFLEDIYVERSYQSSLRLQAESKSSSIFFLFFLFSKGDGGRGAAFLLRNDELHLDRRTSGRPSPSRQFVEYLATMPFTTSDGFDHDGVVHLAMGFY